MVAAAATLATVTTGPVAAQPPSTQVVQITAGLRHTCLRTGSDKAYCWGNGESGQLGNGDTKYQERPVAVSAPPGVTFTQLTAGAFHTCGLGSDTNAYCWGGNNAGELGNGGTTIQSSPVPVSAPPGVTFTHLAAGTQHTCGLGSDMRAYCWGAAPAASWATAAPRTSRVP